MGEQWIMGRRTAERIVVTLVRDRHKLDRIHRLVHDAYVDSGYISPQPRGRLIYCPHLDLIPETTVFVAESAGQIVGTSTLTLDGPAGFHLDDEYPDEVAAVRREVRSLACSWRFALKAPTSQRVRVFLRLIRANQQFLHAVRVQTCLFTLVAHFEPLYRRLFNAHLIASKPLGHACTSKKLSMFGCRTVLMRWDAERCPRRWLFNATNSPKEKEDSNAI